MEVIWTVPYCAWRGVGFVYCLPACDKGRQKSLVYGICLCGSIITVDFSAALYMIVYGMVKLVDADKKWFKWCMVYLAVAFFLFLVFYPVLSGQPIYEQMARDGLRWLEGWQLVS